MGKRRSKVRPRSPVDVIDVPVDADDSPAVTQSSSAGLWRWLLVGVLVSFAIAEGYVWWQGHAAVPSSVAVTPASAALAPEAVTPQPLLTPAVQGLQTEAQAQITSEYARVMALAATPGTHPSELGEAYGALGELLMAYNLSGAEAAIGVARSLQPTDDRWPYLLGSLQWAAGRADEALADYQQALALSPGDVPSHLHVAEILLELDRPDEAEPVLNDARSLDATNPQTFALLGRLADARKDPAAAIAAYSAALKLQPGATILYRPLAMAYRAQGDQAHSAELIAKAGSDAVQWRDPLSETVKGLQRGSNVQLLRAGLLARHGDLPAAIKLYEAALASDPGNATAHLDLAVARFRQKDTAGAIQAVQDALALKPTGSEASLAHRSLGIYLEAEGQYPQAEASLKKAVEVMPSNAGSQEALADFLRRRGRCNEAVPHYEQVIALDPAVTMRRVRLAMCLVADQRSADARARLEAAQASFPDDRNLIDALARVLAAAQDDAVRDGARAVTLAEPANAKYQSVDSMETLAMAYAEVGRFPDAVRLQRAAINLAQQQGRAAWQSALADNLAKYTAGAPVRSPWPAFIYQQ
jgi:tetratricopeptide (TPR) repeat protein